MINHILSKRYNFTITNLILNGNKIPNLLAIPVNFLPKEGINNIEIDLTTIKIITGELKDICLEYNGKDQYNRGIYLSNKKDNDSIKAAFNPQTQTLSINNNKHPLTIYFSLLAPNDGKETNSYVL